MKTKNNIKESAIEFLKNGQSYKNNAIEFVDDNSWKDTVIIPDDSIDPEERKYLLLLVLITEDENEEKNIFEWIIGRTDTYNRLKSYIIAEAIDIVDSKVLSESSKVSNHISVLQFIRHLRDNELIDDKSDFDIEEYDVGMSEISEY